MTDEKIKEAIERWANGTDFIEVSQAWGLAKYILDTCVKESERTAKIEALEEMKRRLRPILECDTSTDYWAGYQHAGETLEYYIDFKLEPLKAGQ